MSYLDSVYERMKEYADANYKVLNLDDFALGRMLYNYKCHLNAVQNVLEECSESVHMVVTYRAKGDPPFVVHFVNKYKDGKWVDNTWGWTYKGYKYYYIREIGKNEYDSIDTILCNTQNNFLKQFTTPIGRWFHNVNSIC